jgi:hypothetical protein
MSFDRPLPLGHLGVRHNSHHTQHAYWIDVSDDGTHRANVGVASTTIARMP